MLKLSGRVIWRLGSRTTVRKYSSPSATVFKTDKLDVSTNIANNTSENRSSGTENAGNYFYFTTIKYGSR